MLHKAADGESEMLVETGDLAAQDAHFLVQARVLDVKIKTAAPQRIADVSSTFRREHYIGYVLGLDRSQLGNRDLEVRQHLQQKRLETIVGAIDLVDQQHRWTFEASDRAKQRSLEQVFPAENEILERLGIVRFALGDTQAQKLALIVPFVERGVGVEAFVALQPDQLGVEQARDDFGQLGLADAGIALDQQGLAHLPREIDRSGDRGLGDISVAVHRLLQRAYVVVHVCAFSRGTG